MSSRPQTPAPEMSNGGSYDLGATPGNPTDSSPLSQSQSNQRYPEGRFHEDFDTSQRGSSIVDGGMSLRRGDSVLSTSSAVAAPSRGGTLKKKASLNRSSSFKRSSSRRNSRAGSVRSLALGDKEKYAEVDENNSVFFTPVPTSGNPTEILVNRFQAWRKVLKDLVSYFREIQSSYEQRSKSLLKVSNIINNTHMPSMFLSKGGINDANTILKEYHKQSIADGTKARELENNVILQLTGLRSDLNQKIKEIKSLSGDFKNSVDKEMENTKRAVHGLQDALGAVDTSGAGSGKGDPYIVKLGVDRQVERQIDEENYLHRAYLNLEGSGRELESIVIGEVQKAYNIYAGLLKREADESYETVEKLRSGPIALSKDYEWSAFVENDKQFINPRLPVRRVEDIDYPGKNDPAAAEVRSGMLERKSKYLKSYTAGWYVLSPTHLHEFKSADRISSQTPVMSLYLPEQKLGSHAQPGSTSHKFMLKGRQSGSMHRGHSWVFRAESHDTMLAWYEDMRALTEKSGADRDNYVRKHARSISAGSQKAASISSHGSMEEDEADEKPYSATTSSIQTALREQKPQRPQPGGRFPSDLQIQRGIFSERSASSGSEDMNADRSVIAAAGALPGSGIPFGDSGHQVQQGESDLIGHHHQEPQSLDGIVGGPSSQHQVTSTQPHVLDPPSHHDPTAAAATAATTGAVSGAAAYGIHEHSNVQNPVPSSQTQAFETHQQSPNAPLANAQSESSNSAHPAELGTGSESPAPTMTTLEDSIASSAPRAGEVEAGNYFGSAAERDGRPVVANSKTTKSASELHVPGEFPPTPADV